MDGWFTFFLVLQLHILFVSVITWIMLGSSICMDLFLPLRFKFFWECNSRPPCLLKNIIKCSTQNENGSSINDNDNALTCMIFG